MPNIMLQDFSEQVARSFASSLNNTGFAGDLLTAINSSVNAINIKADTETAIERVEALDAELDLDVRYTNVLLMGVTYWLAVFGLRPRGSDPRALPSVGELRAEFDAAINGYQADVRNDLDVDEDDIVGLGATLY